MRIQLPQRFHEAAPCGSEGLLKSLLFQLFMSEALLLLVIRICLGDVLKEELVDQPVEHGLIVAGPQRFWRERLRVSEEPLEAHRQFLIAIHLLLVE